MQKLGFRKIISLKKTKPITNNVYKFKGISKRSEKLPRLPDISLIAMAVSKKQEADRKKKKRTPISIRLTADNKKAKSPQTQQKIKHINLTNTKIKTGIVRKIDIDFVKAAQSKIIGVKTKTNYEKMKKEKEDKTKEKQLALTSSHFHNVVKTIAYKSGKDERKPVIEKIHNATKKISNALTPKKARTKTPPLRIRVDYQNSMS